MSSETGVDWTERLSTLLDLRRESQDWGIANADPQRVLEFIRFFREHDVQHPWELEALAELILASFNDALLQGTACGTYQDAVETFLADHRSRFPVTFGYWANLEPTEFPVAQLLRRGNAP